MTRTCALTSMASMGGVGGLPESKHFQLDAWQVDETAMQMLQNFAEARDPVFNTHG